MTSLPANTYSTKAVARLYQERWEIELGFRDIKSSMQQNAVTLRSKKVDLIYQEVWGAVAGLQRGSSESQSGGNGIWSGPLGHPLQTSLSVHRGPADRDGSSQSDFSEREAVIRVKGRYWRIVSGSPPKAFEAQDGENFKDPVSSGS